MSESWSLRHALHHSVACGMPQVLCWQGLANGVNQPNCGYLHHSSLLHRASSDRQKRAEKWRKPERSSMPTPSQPHTGTGDSDVSPVFSAGSDSCSGKSKTSAYTNPSLCRGHSVCQPNRPGGSLKTRAKSVFHPGVTRPLDDANHIAMPVIGSKNVRATSPQYIASNTKY